MSSPPTNTTYRPDIDGLRSIAVIAVILFHAGFSGFSGGFVGVDVFFAISGFLITRIIIRDIANGEFTVSKFYERRARRIIPALILIILITTPFAWLFFLPHFFSNYCQSIVATLLFSNNFLLANVGAYWDLESNLKPLIHTWSLGIEEQFYVIFPLLLIFTWRFAKKWQIISIIMIGAVSFIAALIGQYKAPSANFFLSTSRAWELMIGCAAAYINIRPRNTDNLISFIGLAAIFVSIFLFDEDTPSQSFYVLLPIFGTIAVLSCSRPGTIVYSVLTFPILVGIGIVSYSAYLWHQPIFALARAASLDDPGPLLMASLSLLAFLLAVLSWKFVEQPFRSSSIFPLLRFVSICALFYTVLIVFGLVVYANKGFPEYTFPNSGVYVYSYAQFNDRVWQYRQDSFPENDHIHVLVLGNSVGRDVANILIEGGILADANLVYQPVIPEYFCQMISTFESLAARADFVVAAIAPGGSDVDGIRRGIQCVRSVSGADIVVLGPKHFGANINPFARVPLEERANSYSRIRDDVIEYNAVLKKALSGEVYIDMLELLGPDGTAAHVFDTDGNPLTADRLHLTRYGALFLAKRLVSSYPELASRLKLSPW